MRLCKFSSCVPTFRRAWLLPACLMAVSISSAQLPPQPKPVDMKLLLLTGSGTEPAYLALKGYLGQIGIPYDAVVLAPPSGPAGALPPLNDAGKTRGFYQGILLATGNLSVCDAAGACRDSLSDIGWTALDTYAATFGVRTLSYYTFPQAKFGLSLVRSVNATATPDNLTLLPAAAPIFSYLNVSNPVKVTNSYAYLATPAPATGETTTPLITMAGSTVAALHKKADGREYLAFTVDSSPSSLHSAILNYGLLNWVTKGVFLGARKIYLTPQVDDIFLANDLFDASVPACKPGGFQVDPLLDLGALCPTLRITGPDLVGLAAWQTSLNSQTQTKDFKVTMAFNGFGATPEGDAPANDSLAAEVRASASKILLGEPLLRSPGSGLLQYDRDRRLLAGGIQQCAGRDRGQRCLRGSFLSSA